MASNKWCRTVDGKGINLFDPEPSIFAVDRIANALARINRFAGHWHNPVSVARHSMRVAERLRFDGCEVETQLQGLFHDAAEAFTTDIPSPLKRLLRIVVPLKAKCISHKRRLFTATSEPEEGSLGYYEFEDALLGCIFNRLEIEHPLRPEVHKIDRLLTEKEKGWVAGTDCSLYAGASTDPDVVATVFKSRAEKLFNERAHAADTPTER